MARVKILIPLSAAFLSLFCSFLLYPDYLSDDAFIHIGFINGMLNGEGFTFAGNKTYGTTSPLWVLLGSGVSLITQNPELSIRFLSGLFTAIALVLFYYLLIKVKIRLPLIILAIISLAINPFVLRWSLTGMESTAAMFLIISLVFLFQKEQSNLVQFTIGILFGLSYLLRPEFLGFFLLTIIYMRIKYKGQLKKLIFIAPAVIIILIWSFYARAEFETIVPNTYIAKSSSKLLVFDLNTFIRDVQAFTSVNIPELLLIIILASLSIFSKLKIKLELIVRNIRDELIDINLILFFLWITAFYVFYVLRDVTIITRYSLIFIPLIILITIYLFEKISDEISKKWFIKITTAYLFFILIYSSIITFNVIKPSADNFVNGFQNTYKEIAAIIKSDSDKSVLSVGVADVGIIGAYSGARVFDPVGLVDRERFRYKSTLEYYTAMKPDFIILREEDKIENVIPPGIHYEILYGKKLPGFGIKETDERIVSLYRIFWK